MKISHFLLAVAVAVLVNIIAILIVEHFKKQKS